MSDVTLEAPEFREYLLALADDDHLMGQQHTEWIGVAPFLEEDMAFASIGQDELGHAAALYALLAGDGDQDLDSLAIGRADDEYRSCHLVECDTAGWDEALVRHWMHDTAEELRWQALADSSAPEVAGLVDRVLREETFHRRHADALLDALLSEPESSGRLLAAVERLLPLGLGIFEPTDGEDALVAAGVATSPLAELRSHWMALLEQRFDIDGTAATPPAQDGRRRRHPDFAARYARMREVADLDPVAVW
ncbi:MAG: phenylacetate-CoA oxygenase subunit PaaC [Acidimicrobiales bacterium]|jgi:ring-1,2-phenylacetyl-CoA epoxidase subunit PaaC|nr:phenylacetate-CoA oxygenase subunit PaaC [Acidimicrobiales bacterium]